MWSPSRALSDEDQARLAKNLALARELGAEIITTTDDDVVRGILRTAREQNATQIVAGKPAGWRVIELVSRRLRVEPSDSRERTD